MAGDKRGRNYKLNPKMVEQIVELIRAGNYARTACEAVGISEQTYYTYLNRGKREATRRQRLTDLGHPVDDNGEGIFLEFLEAVKRAEAESESVAVMHVRRAMSDSWQAAMTYLERKHPDRWGRRDKNINVNVDASKQLDLTKLDDDQLEKLEELLMEAAPDEDDG